MTQILFITPYRFHDPEISMRLDFFEPSPADSPYYQHPKPYSSCCLNLPNDHLGNSLFHELCLRDFRGIFRPACDLA